MRLIDADKMRENLAWCKEQSSHSDSFWDDVIERLDVQPTVDAVPVRHGRWIEEGTAHPALGLSYYICSECKQFWGTFHKGFRLNTVYEYCPHCGADMREE